MNAMRAGVLVVGCGLLAAWGAATAGGARPVGPVRDVSATSAVETPGLGASAMAPSRRSRYTESGASRPATRRDLFQFAAPLVPAAQRAHSSGQTADALAAAVSRAAEALAARPEWRLVGVAEQRDGARVVRTAIITTATEVYLVKVGDFITARFEVARIEAAIVAVRGTQDGSEFVLALR